MVRPDSTKEAQNKLKKLREKEKKIKRDLELAEKQALESEAFENAAIEIGGEIMTHFEVTDLQAFLRWLSANISRITGIKEITDPVRQPAQEPDRTDTNESEEKEEG